MAPDTMSVRLHLRLIRVDEVLTDTISTLVVAVSSTRSWSRCPFCGFKCRDVHDTRTKKIRDLPVSGRKVTLLWSRRRFVCLNCDERHLENHDEFEGRLTRRLARAVVADARVMSIRAVARRHDLGWHTVMTLVSAWAALVGAHRRAKRCRILLVDETSIKRRHNYVTVIQNGETGEVLAMVAHRDAKALAGFLAAQGHRWCRGVKVVVTDGSVSYRSAIEARLGHATHVVDRFHVVRWFASGLTALRRQMQRREPRGLVTPAFERDLFSARFLLLTRRDHLDDHQRERLDALFTKWPRLAKGWEALQELYGIYTADDLEGAEKALEAFTALYATGELPEFTTVTRAILTWGEQILAFHTGARISNGRLEGTNNKLQVLRRVAYGFISVGNFESRGILACGPIRSPIPEPAGLTP